jgi:hypothetical protein
MGTISNPTRRLLLHHEQTGQLDDFLLYCATVGAETIEGVTQGAQAKLKVRDCPPAGGT